LNRPFARSVVTVAILDGILHHSIIANIDGVSYRLKDKCSAGGLPTPLRHHKDCSRVNMKREAERISVITRRETVSAARITFPSMA
jgi:hypothetical protein